MGSWTSRVRGEAPAYLATGAALIALAAVVLRNGELGSPGQYPGGTNALNTWLVFSYLQHQPVGVWLFPFTDWGQPYSGFSGPTLYTLLLGAANPTSAVRFVEGTSFVAAGLGVLWAVRATGGQAWAGAVAGVYYTLAAETSQYFEGHVPAMVSVALGPVFFVLLWKFLRRPEPGTGLATVVVLYLLASIGDAGILYFYAFFAVLLAAYVFVHRVDRVRFRLREFASLGAAVVLLLAVSVSAWFPVAFGVRPQYTTNITSNVLPFSLTSGENIGYAFAGYVQDNSYVHFTYGQLAYGPGGGNFLPYAWLIPLALTAYVLLTWRGPRLAAFGSAMLAVVFATGHLYPGLAQLNGVLYDHVPFDNAIPAVFRWTEYTLIVYALLIGSLLTSVQRDVTAGLPRLRSIAARVARRLPGPSPWRGRLPLPGGRTGARILAPTLGAAIVVLVLLQNVAIVTEAPGTYEYPSAYTASFGYLSGRPITGEVLAIPFGGIYDRAPWDGVAGSAALLTPAMTGADTAIFEAGTAPSLAIDEFVNDGLTYGGSRNMTKFLGSANVQYIVTTEYSNWSYSSSSASPARLSYEALSNQTGLGNASAISSVQSVYAPGDSAGNLSFHPSYLIYFGNDSILYSILDSTWYPGPSMALVDGGSVGPALPEFIAHAAGVVADPAGLANLGASVIAAAAAAHVPVIEIVPPSEFVGRGTEIRNDPWNDTGGVDFQFDGWGRTASINLSTQLLYAAGFQNLTLSGQLAGPPGAVVSATLGSTTVQQPLNSGTLSASVGVNSSAPGFFSAGVENSTSAGNLSIEGNGTAIWAPNGSASDYQYVRLALSNLSGWNGLRVTVKSALPVPLVERLRYGTTFFDISGYPTVVPTAKNLWQYWFLYPAGDFDMPSSLLHHLGNVTSLDLGLLPPGPASPITFANVTLVDVSTPRLASVELTPVPANATTLTISLPPTGRLGFLLVSSGSFPVAAPYVRDTQSQASATELDFSSATPGWGILTLAQTYSTQWTVSGSGAGPLAEVDVGLTGWLVNATATATFHVRYGGQALEVESLYLEVAAVPIALTPWWYPRLRTLWPARRRAPGAS